MGEVLANVGELEGVISIMNFIVLVSVFSGLP